MNEGFLRFNSLFEELKVDRLKNDSIVEENYVTYCIANHGTILDHTLYVMLQNEV